jgi:hypothetical protein
MAMMDGDLAVVFWAAMMDGSSASMEASFDFCNDKGFYFV